MSTPPPDPTMNVLRRGIILRPATPPAAEAAASKHLRFQQAHSFQSNPANWPQPEKPVKPDCEQPPQPPAAAFFPQPDMLAATLARSLGPHNTRQLIGLLHEQVEQQEERQRVEEAMRMKEAGGFRMTHWEPVKIEKPTPATIRAARRRRREQMTQQRLLQLQLQQLDLLRQLQQCRTDEDESML